MNAEDSKGTVDLYYSDNNMKTGNFEKEHIVLMRKCHSHQR